MEQPKSGMLIRPGAALRSFRLERGLTLADLSQKTGLQTSTLSKIETGKTELTIDKLLRISLALGVNIADIFATPTDQFTDKPSTGIRSITRAGEGQTVQSSAGNYAYLAYDLLKKNITPILGEVRARTLEEFGALHRHSGEEFVYVLEGELAFYTDTYMPSYLKAGDSIYFDSGMGHAYVRVGEETCRILSVFATPDSEALEFLEGMAQADDEPCVNDREMTIVRKHSDA